MSVPVSMLLCALLAHPTSISSSRLSVDGAEVVLELRCQAASCLQAIALDANGDGRLAASELAAGRDEIERYVLARYRIHVDCAGMPATGRALTGRLATIELVEGALDTALAPEPLVDLSLRFEGSAPFSNIGFGNIGIESSLFQESDPFHRDQAEIVWNDGSRTVRAVRILWIEDPAWVFDPGGGSSAHAIPQYVRLGFDHILGGWDHIVFLVALVVASRRWKALIGVVTAFTIAHSATLALAALGIVDLPGRLVEPAIALSIACVGLRNLFERAPRRLWPEAFGFGLIHGLGFASFLGETLAAEPQKLAALFGFNLGVEIGQLALVVALGVFVAGLRRAPKPGEAAERWLGPRTLRLAVNVLVVALGLYWSLARISSAG